MVKRKSPSIRQLACLAAASLVAGPHSYCVAQEDNAVPSTDRPLPLRASHWSGDSTQLSGSLPGLIEDVAVVRRLPAMPRQTLAPLPLPRPIAISAAPVLHLASAPLRVQAQSPAMPLESAGRSTNEASQQSDSQRSDSQRSDSKLRDGRDSSLSDGKSSSETKPPTNFLPAQLPISSINIDVRTKTEKGNATRPENHSLNVLGTIPVVASAPAIVWSANVPVAPPAAESVVPYQPLYFEEANLERYGRSAGTLQPAVSAGRFFGTIPLLPYAMTNHPPGQAYHWRWPYPAGWLAPRVREHEPINPKAAVVEGSAVTGMFFLLP